MARIFDPQALRAAEKRDHDKARSRLRHPDPDDVPENFFIPNSLSIQQVLIEVNLTPHTRQQLHDAFKRCMVNVYAYPHYIMNDSGEYKRYHREDFFQRFGNVMVNYVEQKTVALPVKRCCLENHFLTTDGSGWMD
jgi:hypothetical protein